MKLLNLIVDKFFVKQWNIGFANADIKQIIKDKNFKPVFTWLPAPDINRFFADPFIFKNTDGNINVIYEDFSNKDQYGKISITTVDQNFKPVITKQILDTGSHLSYPNVFTENGKTFIMPEAGLTGNLTVYEYDFDKMALIKKKDIITGLPLLDSTILKYNNKYWLFATKRGTQSNNELFIYYADKIDGPFTGHKNNPVKNNLNGSRPAGNFILTDGEIYRPAQNSKLYYGKSISINKITVLTEEKFEEEHYITINAPKDTSYNYATHTLNFAEDVIVIDGLKRKFIPFANLTVYLKKIFNPKR